MSSLPNLSVPDSFADSFAGGESNPMLQQQAQQDPFSSVSSNQTKENVPQKWNASGNQGGREAVLES